ncbi:LETM1 domain-containing protein 1-like isoform X2 [Paramacrobiotus metropolitanus]|uniref:LETM1 domain-containing protein 1-like isoform X2 n=1 Tax=Paramacrobiotus metropolitanus TaxID=2943436 RepID=UPI002445D71C|nr:LETM1 domain-containing protein 1-like isoform X2 [Paramacrobiotus metropolitanus]
MRMTSVLRKGVLPESFKRQWNNIVQRRVDAYNDYLQTNFPKIYELQKALTTGVKQILIEGKEYGGAVYQARILRKPWEDLSYRQIYLRNQYPRELWKLGPVLAIMALPFSTFALLPIIYFFPKYFLTHHFWTDAQKKAFAASQITSRLRAVPHLALDLHARLPLIKDPNNRDACASLLSKLKEGRLIHERDILDAQDEFQRGVFRYDKLSVDHQTSLAKLNHIFSLNATYTARNIGLADSYLEKHPDFQLSNQEVRDAVLTRCLYPFADQERLRDFLDVWTSTSTLIKVPL